MILKFEFSNGKKRLINNVIDVIFVFLLKSFMLPSHMYVCFFFNVTLCMHELCILYTTNIHNSYDYLSFMLLNLCYKTFINVQMW